MAHIGIASAAFWGDVMPYAPVGDELAHRGHRVTFAVPDGFHDALRAHDIELVHLGTDFSPRELEEHGDVVARAGSPRGVRAASELWVKRLTVEPAERILQVLEDVGADLWFVHPSLAWLAELVTVPSGVPLVVGHLFPMMVPSAHQAPPVGPPAARAGPWLNRLGWRTARAVTGRMMFDRDINALRRSRGLPAGRAHVAFGWERADAVLLLTSPLYWPRPPDWPDLVRHTGFTVWDGGGVDAPPDLTGWLDAGDPPVLVTLGTSAATNARDAFDLAARAIESAGRRPLLLVGSERNLAALGRRDDAWTFAPLPQVLSRCQAVVHAGGHGTVAAAVHAATPQVVLPQTADQVAHAGRVAALGVGVTVPWRRRDVGRLVDALDAVTAPTVRARAAALAVRLRQEDGASAAADAVEAALHGGGDVGPEPARYSRNPP